ncbi:MAG: hypothetical protein LC737_07765, partial [Chloroflexi bacterium]|nr:hypothetical protein [Chloroflexota bacterium]
EFDAQASSLRVGFLVPAGTPTGAYDLKALVYDQQQNSDTATTVARVMVVAPTTPPPVSALPIGSTLVADWAHARLLGYTLRDGAWQAGDTLHLDLFWQAMQTASSTSTLYVRVQDAGGIVFATNEGATAYPASQWRRGDLIREQRDLTLPATLNAGTYHIVIGWLSSDRRATGGDAVVLRDVEVLARLHRFDTPSVQHRFDARFGEVARLVGYDLTRDAQTISLRLHWQAQQAVSTSYKVFVHLVAPDDKTIAAQHDSTPANGALPTTSWMRGEFIADEHTLQWSSALPSGTYHLLVGLYDPQSGARVPALAADGHEFADDAAELLRIQVDR